MTRLSVPVRPGTFKSCAQLRVEPLEDRTVPSGDGPLVYDSVSGIGQADDGRTFVVLTELPDPARPTETQFGEARSGTRDPVDPFTLHSRPSATKVIYLDFNGHTTTGTGWNNGSRPSIVTPAYSIDGDPAFNAAEQQRIIGIWQRIAEDFSPFDVDVTTEDPGVANIVNAGGGDTRWGIRVIIGGDGAWLGPAGGVAFVSSFGDDVDTGCFVFEDNLGGGDEKATAEAASHEVGHTLGLLHDGRNSPNEEYYQGHGSGETAWAPVMGVGYYVNLVQWSKGEYASASNSEDDLAKITTQNGFGYRPDDHGNALGGATPVTLDTPTSISGAGLIERRSDADYFSVRAGAGPLTIAVRSAAKGANLDVLAVLYDDEGVPVASANPADGLDAIISYNVPRAGDFFLKVDGTGKGSPTGTGYSDYGSLGQYTVNGTIVEPPPPEPIQVLGLQTLESATGQVTAIRVTFNGPPDLTSFKNGNLRVTGPTGAAVPVTTIRPVAGSETVFDLVIRPQKFVGTGGVRLYLSPQVSTGFKLMDQDGDGVDGEPEDFLGAAAYPFHSTAAGAINDDGTVTEFPIAVPARNAGQPLNVRDVNVRVNLTHPYLSDLLIELESPSGKVVKLFDHRGADGNDLKDTRFDDLAVRTFDTGVAPFVGTFRPDGDSLADFNGDDAVGTWKLRVTDSYAGAGGQLNSWGMTLTTDGARTGLHLTAVTPVSETGSSVATLVSGLTLDFDAPVNPATLTTTDVKATDPRGRVVKVLSVVPAAGQGNTRFLVATAAWTVAGNYIVKVGPAVADLWGNGLDTSDNKAFLDLADKFVQTIPVANHVFRSKAKPVAIPDAGTVTTGIAVGTAVAIGSLAIEINIQHARVGDLKVTLIAPNGTQIVLIDRSGTGSNFVRTVLSDEAPAGNTIATGAAPYRGDFRPDVGLAGLIGTQAKGTWKLKVEDAAAGETGKLLSWAIYVKPQ